MRIAAFIDLLGTLGGNPSSNTYNFNLFPYAISAIKKLNKNNILALVITNQSHIAKGLLSIDDFNKHVLEIKKILKDNNAYLDGFYCCPHSKDDNCNCKKPKTGMIEQAKKDFDIDIENSYVIGDRGNSDMLLAKNINAKSILVLTGVGVGSLNEYKYTWKDYEANYITKDIENAVDIIISNIN